MENSDQLDFAHFLASAIHDMKNSLLVMAGSMEGVAEELQPDNPELAIRMGKIIAETRRLNNRLVGLLSIYKIGKGLYPLDIQECSIGDAIEEVLLNNASLAELKHVKVEVDCEPDCFWYVDRELFMGIVNNALNNALNYTCDKVTITAAREKDEIQVRIEDNGKGFPLFILEADFDSRAGTGSQTGGTGLGLFFSEQAARLHQNQGRAGSVRLENGGRLGGGCFVLALP